MCVKLAETSPNPHVHWKNTRPHDPSLIAHRPPPTACHLHLSCPKLEGELDLVVVTADGPTSKEALQVAAAKDQGANPNIAHPATCPDGIRTNLICRLRMVDVQHPGSQQHVCYVRKWPVRCSLTLPSACRRWCEAVGAQCYRCSMDSTIFGGTTTDSTHLASLEDLYLQDTHIEHAALRDVAGISRLSGVDGHLHT